MTHLDKGNAMSRTKTSYRTLIAVAGLSLLAACAESPPAQPQVATRLPPAGADGPQLAGAWYQVMFDNNSTEINARGHMMLQTVADVVKADDKVRIDIVGKTDRVGSAAANARLSQRRANLVRDALIALSVPPSRINTYWAGEGMQEVATADNIAEQRNRVVDISVQHPY